MVINICRFKIKSVCKLNHEAIVTEMCSQFLFEHQFTPNLIVSCSVFIENFHIFSIKVINFFNIAVYWWKFQFFIYQRWICFVSFSHDYFISNATMLQICIYKLDSCTLSTYISPRTGLCKLFSLFFIPANKFNLE